MPRDKRAIAFCARVELAKRRFFDFCHLMAPDFYKEDRRYLQDMCDTLQDFIESKEHDVLIIDLPPRHGKSRTLQMLVEWSLGRNKHLKVMTGSYNETLSKVFAKTVRDAISEEKGDLYRPVYSDVFPDIAIKPGDGAANLWGLVGGYNNYLATSPTGTATGFGCDLLIIDDVIKNAEEAYNANVKEKHWGWFVNTMLSRLEQGGKIIIVMTRWASDDLAGRALEHFGSDVVHINMKAIQEDGSMLCDEILSAYSCEKKKKAMGYDIWSANYQQEPIDIKGRLYPRFKTYSQPPKFKKICSYTDTADTGADYLASAVYGIDFMGDAYILDAVYTQDAMEITEPAVAAMFYRNKVNVADIESNNGGRGFARNVQRLLKDVHKSNYTSIHWFTQHKNKVARILSNATWVAEHIYFPEGWENKWPDLHEALAKYQKEGKNLHDDAPDMLTGICEKITEASKPTPTRVNY